MRVNWIFILVILLILLLFFITVRKENFYISESKYKLIIVKNKNYVFIHVKNLSNGENKIYKIYKNKFII